MTLLAFALSFLTFISFPSRLWNFDGVACAAALELGNPVFFFHSNHLLYGFFGYLFWRATGLVSDLRALPALQLFTSLLGAAGIAGLYAVLKKELPARPALLLALMISVTAVVWQWSIEAQVYALGFAALSGATREIFQPADPKKWLRVGAWHGAAVLAHIVHVLWVVPALYVLWSDDTRDRTSKNFRKYLLALGIVIAVPYVLVLVGIIFPQHESASWGRTWLLGSAALNAERTFQWHLSGWEGPLIWARTTLRMFWGSFWPYTSSAVPAWCWLFTAISGIGILALAGASFKKRKETSWTFCMLWLAVYGIFFWTWEPATECYRMTDLIPVGLLMALGLKTWKNPVGQVMIAGLLFATVFPVNFVTRIGLLQDAQRNRIYQETLRLAEKSPADSVYLTAGGVPWIYLLYFEGRTAWNLLYYQQDPERLTRQIQYLQNRHNRLYLRQDALQNGLFNPWMKRHRLEPLDASLPWLMLQ